MLYNIATIIDNCRTTVIYTTIYFDETMLNTVMPFSSLYLHMQLLVSRYPLTGLIVYCSFNVYKQLGRFGYKFE